jgi:hypothetical protein
MKTKSVFLLLLALVMMSGCGGAQELQWQSFDSDVGRFSVEFPGEPEEQSQSISTAVGSIETWTLMVEEQGAGFSVSFADYPQEIIAASETALMLDGARDGAVANISGILLEENEISLDGHPGREIEVEVKEEDVVVRARFYLVENRLYVIQAISETSKVSEDDFVRFLNSFVIEP